MSIKIKTSLDSPLRIADLVMPCGGVVGMTICPGKKSPTSISGHAWDRDLLIDLQIIKDWGAATVITLMEAWELEQYEVADLGREVEAAGMRWLHLPIVDGAAPDANWDAAWPRYLSALMQSLAAGEKILVHCLGGRGRTGTMVALLLMQEGLQAEEAIRQVRAAREGMIETRVQEEYLLRARPPESALPTRRPHYTLTQLMAECEEAGGLPVLKDWDAAPPVGRECLDPKGSK